MSFFEKILKGMYEYKKLSSSLNKGQTPIGVTGVSGIHKAQIIHSIQKEQNKKVFVITADEIEANKLANDLTFMGSRAFVYSSRDFNFRDIEGVSHEYTHKRIDVLSKIVSNEFDVIITGVEAALQYTIPPEKLVESTINVSSIDSINLTEFEEKLVALGYERANKVEGKGQFSIRGGIFDIFVPCYNEPLRIELWGDDVDTISYFDVDTQRRYKQIEKFKIVPASEVIIENKERLIEKINTIFNNLKGKGSINAKEILKAELTKLENNVHLSSKDKFIKVVYEKSATLFDYISNNSFIFISEPTKIDSTYNNVKWQWNEDLKLNFENGVLCKGLDSFCEDMSFANIQFQAHKTIYLDTFIHKSYPISIKDTINFTAIQLSTWSGSISLLKEDLESNKGKLTTCVILAGTEKSARSVYEDLSADGFNIEYKDMLDNIVPGKIFVLPGSLSGGFEYPSINFKLITHGHFHKPKIKKSVKTNNKSLHSLSELTPGDYVVHFLHGIGVFRGIRKISMDNIIKDYITIEYSKGDILYVPVTQLDLVSKYIGSRENTSIKLNNLGSNEWQRTKTKVRSKVKDIADHLIKLYSERMKAVGYAFSKDNSWQRDFESHFEYEETQDQLRCITEIKNDMERDVPMDRLLCGDVGFGKTEVALRAAFKCVCDSKQCAMLVPTTILSWQHYQTVCRRFEGFDVRIELLSRFRTPKQQQEILKKLKHGEIDMVIGTHRLIQDDVKFRDLGLVIIDEEQRFGVKQKEHFKNSFKNVDILTLSATPIPRTLNMAMSGIRDMSTLEEAPQDRYPVQTYVLEHDTGVIIEAIKKELRRGGQVFYLHNKVESIKNVAGKIQNLLPEAKVGIGHGKMSENELSNVWKQVIDQEINVLVCTTIIETGVDLPNVNTLIIENADCMGLSQLHQLRGRVGRSSRRAYAYLTFTKNKVLREVSQKRLAAIREFTEFGSGFKISLRDLEIRGAGNILGGEQHGYMSDVGYDMYIKLLNDAINEKKGEKKKDVQSECLVDIQVPAHIPEKYIPSLNERIDIYRRISDIRNQEDVSDVIDELVDRFGDPPKSVIGLVEVAIIRSMAINCQITEIKQRDNELMLFQEKIDLEFFSKLTLKLGKKIKINASAKPFMSIELDNNEKPIDMLRKALT